MEIIVVLGGLRAPPVGLGRWILHNFDGSAILSKFRTSLTQTGAKCCLIFDIVSSKHAGIGVCKGLLFRAAWKPERFRKVPKGAERFRKVREGSEEVAEKLREVLKKVRAAKIKRVLKRARVCDLQRVYKEYKR